MATGTIRRNIRFFAWESVAEGNEFDLDQAMADVAVLDEDEWRLDATDLSEAASAHRPG
jgi:hypothetical protein